MCQHRRRLYLCTVWLLSKLLVSFGCIGCLYTAAVTSLPTEGEVNTHKLQHMAPVGSSCHDHRVLKRKEVHASYSIGCQ